VVGAEGVVHLPAHIARDWPQGTLVRIEPEHDDRLLLSRGDDDEDDEAHPDHPDHWDHGVHITDGEVS